MVLTLNIFPTVKIVCFNTAKGKDKGNGKENYLKLQITIRRNVIFLIFCADTIEILLRWRVSFFLIMFGFMQTGIALLSTGMEHKKMQQISLGSGARKLAR